MHRQPITIMKKHAATKPTEEVFSVLLVVMVLLILPQLGAIAMMVGSTIGLGLYVFLFPDRFRTRRGSLNVAIALVTLLALLVGVVVALSLTHRFE